MLTSQVRSSVRRLAALFTVLCMLGVWPEAHPAIFAIDPTPLPPSGKLSPFEKAISDGYKAIEAQQLDRASQIFKDAAGLDPKSPIPWLGLAEIARLNNDAKAVESAIKKSLTIAPRSVAVHSAWGRYLFVIGKLSEAEASLKKAVELDPKSSRALIDLGDFYMNGPRSPQQAEKSYRHALALDPNHAGASYALGVALLAQNDLKGAEEMLKRAAELAPANPLPQFTVGGLYMDTKRYDLALTAYDLALKRKPDFVDARLARGDVFAARKEFDKAEREYELAIQTAPNSLAAHLRSAMLHQHLKKWSESERGYLKAIALDPNDPIAYNNLAWSAAERKVRLDDALIWARKAVELGPKHAGHYDTLGWVYRARGELKLAVDAFNKALELNGRHPGFHYRIGVVHNQMGNKSEAIAALKKAVELDSKYSEARDLLKRIDR
jgi:tetratricopeptide (TPR) repeat protein